MKDGPCAYWCYRHTAGIQLKLSYFSAGDKLIMIVVCKISPLLFLLLTFPVSLWEMWACPGTTSVWSYLNQAPLCDILIVMLVKSLVSGPCDLRKLKLILVLFGSADLALW